MIILARSYTFSLLCYAALCRSFTLTVAVQAVQNRTIHMDQDGLLTWVFILLAVLVAYFFSIVLSGWRITPRIGYVLITLYVAFATFNIVTWIMSVKSS